MLTDPRCPVEGIKHVHSPFNQRMAGEEAALRGLLSLRGLKVILLSRRDVAAQFISMEIALQTGDWWSAGPGALPKAIGPVRAGSEASLDDAAIAARLLRLSRAAEWLKQLCTATGARFVERSYEDLFCEDRDRAGRRVASVLKHFAPVTGKTRALRVIIGKGQRFNEVDALRRQLGKLYPSLRKSTDSRRQTATKLPMRARGGRVRADSSGARR